MIDSASVNAWPTQRPCGRLNTALQLQRFDYGNCAGLVRRLGVARVSGAHGRVATVKILPNRRTLCGG